MTLSQPLTAQAPTNPYTGEYSVLTGNTLVAVYALNGATTKDWSKSEIMHLIRSRYPEMADLLICMITKESQFNRNAIGDNGKAKSYFQIHTKENNITEECAFDFECALDWTVKEIESGHAYKWSTYKQCQ